MSLMVYLYKKEELKTVVEFLRMKGDIFEFYKKLKELKKKYITTLLANNK